MVNESTGFLKKHIKRFLFQTYCECYCLYLCLFLFNVEIEELFWYKRGLSSHLTKR